MAVRPLPPSRSPSLLGTHRDDPQLLANLLGSFPKVTALETTVGPLFAPEQLEELLEKPKWRSAIEQLAFRFNPYVEERSYYTFLKVSPCRVDWALMRTGMSQGRSESEHRA